MAELAVNDETVAAEEKPVAENAEAASLAAEKKDKKKEKKEKEKKEKPQKEKKPQGPGQAGKQNSQQHAHVILDPLRVRLVGVQAPQIQRFLLIGKEAIHLSSSWSECVSFEHSWGLDESGA